MSIDHVKATMASLLKSALDVNTYQIDVGDTSFIWKVTEVGGEKHIVASTDADQVPFPTLGAYSGDRKESKYAKTTMTHHYDACYRSFFGHGVSQNPKAEAAAILAMREPHSPFKIPPPVFAGGANPIPSATKNVVPPGASVPDVPPVASPPVIEKNTDEDPTVAAFWDDVQPTASSLQPGSALFDLVGPHTMTPAKAQLQLEFLSLTAVETRAMLFAALNSCEGQMHTSVNAVIQAVKGFLKSWSKGKLHGSISGVQNQVPGYDYHAVFSFILTQASAYYGKVGIFNVVSAG